MQNRVAKQGWPPVELTVHTFRGAVKEDMHVVRPESSARCGTFLSLIVTASALSAKGQMRDIFGIDRGSASAILACPVTKEPLRCEVSVVGSEVRRVLRTSGGARYPLTREYADLLPRSSVRPVGLDELRSQVAEEVFSIFSMQTGFFRSPVMAFLYERGWRQVTSTMARANVIGAALSDVAVRHSAALTRPACLRSPECLRILRRRASLALTRSLPR